MPSFVYHTLGSGAAGGGQESAAVIDAPDRAAALRLLRAKGITPSRVEPVSERQARRLSRGGGNGAAHSSSGAASSSDAHAPRAERPRRAGGGGSMSRPDLARFIRELATATQAGLPLVPALKTILKQRSAPRQRRAIEKIVHQVEHGKALADAAASVGRPFGELTVNLIRAGEVSGKLDVVLEQTATLLERDLKLRRQVLFGMAYPAFLGVLIAGAIGVLVGFIIPKILESMAGRLGASGLPLPTRMVMWVGDLFAHWWWLIGGAIALTVLLVDRAYRLPASRLAIDRGLLRVPVLGTLLRDIAVARFTRTLGTLINAGLPALTALRITRGTLGNKAMEQVVEQVCEQVSGGKTIGEPMERSGYFPPLLTQVIGLGERSGRLGQVINQAAGAFEERVETSLKVFTSVLPNLLFLIAAATIGFVMAAVLLPLLQLQEAIQ